jgi:hypothetical protein
MTHTVTQLRRWQTTTMSERVFYKLEIQGIVYLVDPKTTLAYLYDNADPTLIGKVIWTDNKASPQIELLPDWQEIQARKLAATAATATH